MTIKDSLTKLQPFWNNPVIIRDMRVRMRGARAFWNQAAYLFVLASIAVFAYFESTVNTNAGNAQVVDPVQIQQNLQMFYYAIFEALALLITLIAPALTAVSIVSEKKQQTFDLLVTTPMTAMQMLTGKLISSIAFIVLLLVLSIPVSALCIILGGATITDVLQTYALLIIDGIVLSSIGLSFSCSCKQHVQAVVATYGAIILLYIVCTVTLSSCAGIFLSSGGSIGHRTGPAVLAVANLLPFATPLLSGSNVSIGGFTIPSWIATAIVGFVFVRLILTSAAIRIGMYGTGLIASFRRQMLLLSVIGVFLYAELLVQVGNIWDENAAQKAAATLIIIVAVCSQFFLPGLFVPKVDENGPPNQTIKGSYHPLKSFSAQHSGALPFFQVWLFVIACAAVAGIYCPSGPMLASRLFTRAAAMSSTGPTFTLWPLVTMAASMYVYISGLGFLFWSIARRAAWFSTSSAFAKVISYIIFMFILLLPVLIMLLLESLSSSESWSPGKIQYTTLLYPISALFSKDHHPHTYLKLCGYGGIAYVLGTVIYPFWMNVTPGGISSLRKKRSDTMSHT
jgi:ABC-type transport system involved in multi-copper enzyme maturation permease subunit